MCKTRWSRALVAPWLEDFCGTMNDDDYAKFNTCLKSLFDNNFSLNDFRFDSNPSLHLFKSWVWGESSWKTWVTLREAVASNISWVTFGDLRSMTPPSRVPLKVIDQILVLTKLICIGQGNDICAVILCLRWFADSSFLFFAQLSSFRSLVDLSSIYAKTLRGLTKGYLGLRHYRLDSTVSCHHPVESCFARR